MSLTLFTYPNNYRALKSAVVANLCEIDISVPSADEFKFPEGLKTDEFKELNPVGKVPVLVTPDGPIFESNAILRYLARSAPRFNLTGRSFYEQAQVDQWLDFTAFELEPPRNLWIYPLQGLMKIDARAAKKAKNDVEVNMGILNKHLQTRTFMVGERLTIADIALAAALVEPFRRVFDPEARAKFPHVTRWFTTLINQDFWKKVQGDVKFCEKSETPAAPEKKQKQKQKGGQKQQQPKQQAKKADSADDAAKKELQARERKAKGYMEDTKRLFSNNDFPTAIAKFWETFDANEYSLYTSVYNYNEDNTSDFRTSNLVSGWMQRLESTRKYGFGAVNVWGVEDTSGPFPITGAWLLWGTKGLEEFKACPDSEYHTLTKVDVSDAAAKKLFEDYLGAAEKTSLNDKEIPLYERKMFK